MSNSTTTAITTNSFNNSITWQDEIYSNNFILIIFCTLIENLSRQTTIRYYQQPDLINPVPIDDKTLPPSLLELDLSKPNDFSCLKSLNQLKKLVFYPVQ
ncbi:hypothetical protein ACTFIV_010379 [Dictyostelium citrinum]